MLFGFLFSLGDSVPDKLIVRLELSEREMILLLGLVTAQAEEVAIWISSQGRPLGGSRLSTWRRISDELCRAIIKARDETG